MDTNSNRLTAEEIRKLREMNFCKEPGFVKAEAVLASEAGETGSRTYTFTEYHKTANN